MRPQVILTSLLAAANIIVARPASRQTTYDVSIAAVISSGLDPAVVEEIFPVQINILTACFENNTQGCSVSSLRLQPNSSTNVNENAIECRAYKDTAGVIPGSAPFNLTSPALISTNLATISTLLCYVVEVD
jgi:hypothetical protein